MDPDSLGRLDFDALDDIAGLQAGLYRDDPSRAQDFLNWTRREAVEAMRAPGFEHAWRHDRARVVEPAALELTFGTDSVRELIEQFDILTAAWNADNGRALTAMRESLLAVHRTAVTNLIEHAVRAQPPAPPAPVAARPDTVDNATLARLMDAFDAGTLTPGDEDCARMVQTLLDQDAVKRLPDAYLELTEALLRDGRVSNTPPTA